MVPQNSDKSTNYLTFCASGRPCVTGVQHFVRNLQNYRTLFVEIFCLLYSFLWKGAANESGSRQLWGEEGSARYAE